MAKPSIYTQVDAVAIPPADLRKSPRHWNPGLFRYAGKLWLAYRHHREEAGQRCGVAIVKLDDTTLLPRGANSLLKFRNSDDNMHHEDARLFALRGEPYISYTEMSGYKPGVDYSCVVKYAKLKYDRGRWSVLQEWQPNYGRNTGASKEKNWVFFACADKLFCVYAINPQHHVLEIEGERVVGEYRAPGPAWSFGEARGGSSPILVDGKFVSMFHSSLATEVPPHFVRYYAGAYEFEAKAPFAPTRSTAYPMFSGSEEDGHQVDPRYVEGWKPYVVFPCGLVDDGDKFLCSMGVNDWQCAMARLPKDSFSRQMGTIDGLSSGVRFFRTGNGSLAVPLYREGGRPAICEWQVFAPGRGGTPGTGYMEVSDPRMALEVMEAPNVSEISLEEYQKAKRDAGRGNYQNPSYLTVRR